MRLVWRLGFWTTFCANIEQRGIDFVPAEDPLQSLKAATDDYLQEVHLADCEDELISSLKNVKVTKPGHAEPLLQAGQTELRQ